MDTIDMTAGAIVVALVATIGAFKMRAQIATDKMEEKLNACSQTKK